MKLEGKVAIITGSSRVSAAGLQILKKKFGIG